VVVGLSVTVRHDTAGSACVSVEGDVDLATVGQLDHNIQAAVDADQTTGVVVDLTEVAFLDSSGIASLLKGRRLADAAGKRYRVTGATGIVRQVLDLTGVWAHLADPST
jgi:anti-sigma B factor antagonist